MDRNNQSTKVNVRIPNETHDKLEGIATRELRPLSQLITWALDYWIAAGCPAPTLSKAKVPGNTGKKRSR